MKLPLYRSLIRPVLFCRDAENAHDRALGALARISSSPFLCKLVSLLCAEKDSRLGRTVMGLHFPNPIGIAAGFTKNGRGLAALEALGFGFAEVGGVTPLPQPGNPKPRIFRLVEDESIINRMGFNNDGANALLKTLRAECTSSFPIGINLGKNKDTPMENAVSDYRYCFELLYFDGDFFVINVSSPNTPGLRNLQDPAELGRILRILGEKREIFSQKTGKRPKPVLVKISPDLDLDNLRRILDTIERAGMQGAVVANTTTARPRLASMHRGETGGLSGPPLFAQTLAMTSTAKRHNPLLTIIASGGVATAEDAWLLLQQAKADLIEIYTAFVYRGPTLARDLNRGILEQIRREFLQSMAHVGKT